MPEEQGKYRTVNVKAAGTEHQYPDHIQIPNLMQRFVAELATGNLHPVGRAVKAHYDFVSIHPFRDGNGRTGRLLMNLLLIQSGYVPAILRVERRTDYIDSLVHAQSNDDDLSKLTMLVCNELESALEEVISLAS